MSTTTTPFPWPVNSPMWSNQGSGPGQVNLGTLTANWLSALQAAQGGSSSSSSSGSGTGTGSSTGTGSAVGNVTAISVSAAMDPLTGIVTLDVSVTPPDDLTFVGCHLYLEIPDQSAAGANVAGATAVGATPVGGKWNPLDLGQQPYVAGLGPWTLTVAAPPGVNVNQDIACRLYACSYSANYDDPLIEANKTGASPNQAFTVVSEASGTPSSAENITGSNSLAGPLTALVLPNDSSTGKLETPVIVTVSSVPTSVKGWVCQLILVWAGNDPTKTANQQTVGNIFSTAGPVYGSPDGLQLPNTFAVATPTSVVNATIYAVAGLLSSSGAYQWNNLIPGITPSCGITLGTASGTIDAASVMLSTLEASMAVVAGLFGVAAAGITNSLLGSAAVATINVQSLAITNPLLASLAVQASNMAANSVTAGNSALAALAVGTAAIQTGAITNALIANLAVGTAQIQYAAVLGANIGLATIADANIGSCSVSKLTAGSATFSGTATFTMGSGLPTVTLSGAGLFMSASGNTVQLTAGGGLQLVNGSYSVSVTSAHVQLTDGTNTFTLTPSGGSQLGTGSYGLNIAATSLSLTTGSSSLYANGSTLYLESGTNFLTLTSSAVNMTDGTNTINLTPGTGVKLSNGSTSLLLTSSTIVLTSSSGPVVTITDTPSALVTIQNGTNSKITLDGSGNAVFTGTSGTSSTINGNSISTGTLLAASLQLNTGTITFPFSGASSTASAGVYGQPTLVAGFVEVVVGSTTYKLPLYLP